MFGGGPKFGGVEREYLSREREEAPSAPPAGPTREGLESAEERIVAEVQERAASRRAGGVEPRPSPSSSESPRVLDVKLGTAENADNVSLVERLKERLSGKGLIKKILAIRNSGRDSSANEAAEGESWKDLPLNLRAKQPPLPPQASRVEIEDEGTIGESIPDREPDAAPAIPRADSEKYDSGKTQPVSIVRPEHVFREKHEARSEAENEQSFEGRIEKLESALAESRRRHVFAEGEWAKLDKEWQKRMNFAEMSTGRPEAIIRREIVHAEYRSAKEALVDHLWAEKKGEVAARLGKAWEEMGDDERAQAEAEMAEFKVREIFPRFVIGEAGELQKLKLDSCAPTEQGMFRRMFKAGADIYLRQNKYARIAFSSLVIGGGSAMFAGVGAAVGTSMVIQRFVRALGGVAGGQAAAFGANKVMDRLWGNVDEKREAAVAKLQDEFSLEDADAAVAEYQKIANAERAERRKRLVIRAAAMLAGGAGANMLAAGGVHALGAHGAGSVSHPEPVPGQPRVNIVGRVPEGMPRSATPAGEVASASRAVPAPESALSPKPSPEVSPAPRAAGEIKLPVHEELSEPKASASPEAKAITTEPTPTAPARVGMAGSMRAAAMKAAEQGADPAIVQHDEGAWQAVHRQLGARLRLHPEKFGLKAEDLGNSEKIERALNAKTATILQKEGFIAPDGSTRIGIRAGDFRVRLDDNDHLTVEKSGVSAREAGTYDFQKVHAAPKVAPESSAEAASAPESVPTGDHALPEVAGQIVGSAPEAPETTPESLAGHEAKSVVESTAASSPESFVVRVPENFSFRQMISDEIHRHYADDFDSLDYEGRENLLRLLERHAADHPELFPGKNLAAVKTGDSLDFQGLLGNGGFFEDRLDDVRQSMLERIVSPRELETLSDLGFTGDDFFEEKALGVIRDMKVADFLDHFRDSQGGIDYGQISHQVRFTGSDGEAVTTMLRGRHIKLAELLQGLNLDEKTAHIKTVSQALRAVER